MALSNNYYKNFNFYECHNCDLPKQFFFSWQKWGSMSIWYYCMFETNTLVLINNVCPCFNEWYCSVECKRLMLLCVSVVISMMMMICSEHNIWGSQPFTFNISRVDRVFVGLLPIRKVFFIAGHPVAFLYFLLASFPEAASLPETHRLMLLEHMNSLSCL